MHIKTEKLANQLWSISSDLRGNMDSSKFKNYILGTIFYRYLSERAEKVMDIILKAYNVKYRDVHENNTLATRVKEMSLNDLGYFIDPKYLFNALVVSVRDGSFTIGDFDNAISSLIASTIGNDSERAFEGLFDDMSLQDKDLGRDKNQRTALIGKVIDKVNTIDIDISDDGFDILGTAYIILIGLFASDAGKKGGEFYTPQKMSGLIARLATLGLDTVDSVCDPCAGSGSLLLEVSRQCSNHKVKHYYAQEKNGTTYNLLRQNMLIHSVPYTDLTVYNDDTIERDNFNDLKFQIQVSNPPYSATWSADGKFLEDPRFSGCGVLSTKSYADLMFLQHIVYHMSDDGRAVVLLPHGVLFRGAREREIRRYLISDLNVIDGIIGLPPKCFIGTNIAVCCIILCKKRTNKDDIWFCDVSRDYVKFKSRNELTDDCIDRIVDSYSNRLERDKFCCRVPIDKITDNNYNCNISLYIDSFDDEEQIDIQLVRAELAEITANKQAALDKVNNLMAQLGL